MSDSLIIAVDPGVVTGLAFDTLLKPPTGMELPEDEAVDEILAALAGESDANILVVCEDFIPRPGAMTWYPNSLHTIGWLKHECRRCRIPFRLQSVAPAKKFATNEKLRRVGWYEIAMKAYRPDITSHPQAIDAFRHLLLTEVKLGIVNPEDLILYES